MKTKIKTFEDACNFLGKEAISPDPKLFGKHTTALYKLTVIIEARNKEADPNFKVFDYNNWNQRKYFQWVDMEKTEENPSGFRLDSALCVSTLSCVGSRLCTISRELCVDVFEKHIDLYRDFMVKRVINDKIEE